MKTTNVLLNVFTAALLAACGAVGEMDAGDGNERATASLQGGKGDGRDERASTIATVLEIVNAIDYFPPGFLDTGCEDRTAFMLMELARAGLSASGIFVRQCGDAVLNQPTKLKGPDGVPLWYDHYTIALYVRNRWGLRQEVIIDPVFDRHDGMSRTAWLARMGVLGQVNTYIAPGNDLDLPTAALNAFSGKCNRVYGLANRRYAAAPPLSWDYRKVLQYESYLRTLLLKAGATHLNDRVRTRTCELLQSIAVNVPADDPYNDVRAWCPQLFNR